ncbi:Zonadhesin [Sarcoptes scabiei]|nr:Zonadhesin [Sarcoptes scabiei]
MRFGISLLAIYLFFLVAVYAYRFDHSFSGFACGRYEQYSHCTTRCQTSCFSKNWLTRCQFLRRCRPGCVCQAGYVRKYLGGRGPCIPKYKCPKKKHCGKHQHWSKCKGHCQLTCRHPKSVKCPAICRPGCICNKGYVRKNDDGTGPCIKKKKCKKLKKKCRGKHQHWSKCKGHCQLTCRHPKSVKCPAICRPGCICNKGYVRKNDDGTGPCIKKKKCKKLKKKCRGKHQRWSRCKGHCQLTCKHPKLVKCPAICKAGCICKKGYVRTNDDGTGPCIKKKKCKKIEPKCLGKHQHFEACGSSCPPTCEFPKGKPVCTTECRIGCVCDRGYVRKNADGTGPCVKPSKCSKPIPPTSKPSCKESMNISNHVDQVVQELVNLLMEKKSALLNAKLDAFVIQDLFV